MSVLLSLQHFAAAFDPRSPRLFPKNTWYELHGPCPYEMARHNCKVIVERETQQPGGDRPGFDSEALDSTGGTHTRPARRGKSSTRSGSRFYPLQRRWPPSACRWWPRWAGSPFRVDVPAISEAPAQIGEPEVGEPEVDEPATTAAEMCVFAPTAASVAGASAPVSGQWRSSSADVPRPASAEDSADPGFVW